jgi:hypothetical protein
MDTVVLEAAPCSRAWKAPAEIVLGHGRRLSQLKGDGPARIAGGRIQRMRAGVQQDQRVHLEAQRHMVAGGGIGRVKGKAAIGRNRNLAEPVHIGREVAAAYNLLP